MTAWSRRTDKPCQAVRLCSIKVQAPVVQTLDSAIQQINHYSVDENEVSNCAIHWIEIYRLGRQDAQSRKMCVSAIFFCLISANLRSFFLLSSLK